MNKQYIEPKIDLIELQSVQMVCTSNDSLIVSTIDDIEEDGEIIVL